MARGPRHYPTLLPLNDITVCITSFKRDWHLARAIQSVIDAGFTRIAIAAVCPTPEVYSIIADTKTLPFWESCDIRVFETDIGCNDTWKEAAALSRTKRVIILHDDDVLMPELGRAYLGHISKHLGEDRCGFATWEADHITDDGIRTPCRFFNRNPPSVYPSKKLLEFLNNRKAFSLSPVISVLDRDTVIEGCEISKQELTTPASFNGPGMILGTELIVYMLHTARFPRWLYLHDVLSCYGKHAESGTVIAETRRRHAYLIQGYNLARDVGMRFNAK